MDIKDLCLDIQLWDVCDMIRHPTVVSRCSTVISEIINCGHLLCLQQIRTEKNGYWKADIQIGDIHP